MHIIQDSAAPYFPDGLEPDGNGLVALGGELGPAILCEAYRKGIFPWTGAHPIPWFSPDPRMILRPGAVHVSRRLRRELKRGRFTVGFDRDFAAVMRYCAAVARPGQEGTWITPNMIRAYTDLHRRGIAHSVAVYEDGVLCGGIYGLSFGRAFFGESMFHLRDNASKVALVSLCDSLVRAGFMCIDCQQETPHMARMGAVSVSRRAFLRLLDEALAYPSVHRVGVPPWLPAGGARGAAGSLP